jgi:PAS domain S-box-containing protein
MLSPRAPLVLLADEDDASRKSLRDVLERDGYDVIDCADGAAAVTICQQRLPDMILMDIRLPLLTGLAACEQIQRLPGGRPVPVLIITALEGRASVDQCFEAGATDYITRPIDHALLRQRVRRLVQARQTEDALRASELRYRQMFEQSQAIQLLIDPDTGQIIQANRAAAHFYGYSIEDLQQMRIGDINQIDPAWINQEMQVALLERRNPFAFPQLLASGEIRQVEIFSSPIELRGQRVLYSIIHDITAHKQIEDALRDSEARFHLLADHAPVLIWMAGDDTLGTFFNRPWLDFTGRTLEQELGNGWTESVHPDDLQRRLAAYLAAFHDRQPFRVEYRLRRADGVYRWIIDHGLPLFARSGLFTGYIGSCFDITEIKEAHAEVERLARHNELILTSAGEGILGLDVQGDHIFVNPAAAAMLGRTVQELIGRHSHSTWHHTKADGAPYPQEECPIYAAFQDGLVHRGANEVFWRKDGTSFPVEYISTPMREGDRLTGAVVVFSDITRRKAGEEEIARLYQAEHAQRQLAEALRDTAAQLNNTLNLEEVLDRLLDNVGRVVPHQGAHVLLIDEGEVHLSRMRGLEAPGSMSMPARLSPTDLPALRAMIETGEPYVIDDARTYTEWGQLPHIPWLRSVLGVPVRFKQQVLGFIILMSDMPGYFTNIHAERLQTFADQAAIAIENARLYSAERQQFDRWQQSQSVLVQAEKLTALGRLAAALAHEINNPLQAIQSHLELVMDFPLEADERLEFLKIARQEINRLSQLTRNVLNFARPTPGPRRFTSIDVLIWQTLELAGKQLQHSHIQVTTDLQPTPPVFVAAEQMTQVFLNLILNAVEAIQQNGQIHITARVERDQIAISFNNDGPAIRLADFPHIFEPFYTTKAEGTGLGLSISHRLIQQHGGSLIAENVTDTRGVAFKIYLPIMQINEPAA